MALLYLLDFFKCKIYQDLKEVYWYGWYLICAQLPDKTPPLPKWSSQT